MFAFFTLLLAMVTWHFSTPEQSFIGRSAGGLFVWALSIPDAYKLARIRYESGNPADYRAKLGLRQRSLFLTHFLSAPLTVVLASTCIALLAPNSAFAKVRVCQEQEQRYEQIMANAAPLEDQRRAFSCSGQGLYRRCAPFLDEGASLGSRDRQGAMPLTHAARSGHTDILELFLARGASINARDLDGSTALFIAAEKTIGRPCNLSSRTARM